MLAMTPSLPNRGMSDAAMFQCVRSRPRRAWVVSRFGIFIGIQRRSHGVVSDGMREKLQAVLSNSATAAL